jgi:hypothetical protein
MLPWQRAKQWHEEHIATETFTEALGWHLSAGVVYSSPDAFMLARQVSWDAERREIAINDNAPLNAWLVELAAVSDGADAFGRFMRVAPHPQPWVLWCRRGEMRVRAFNWNKLTKKIGGQ